MCHLNIFDLEVLIDVGITLPVNAGDADADHIMGAQHPAGGLGPGNVEEREYRAGCDSLLQKTATGDFHAASVTSSSNQCTPEGDALIVRKQDRILLLDRGR